MDILIQSLENNVFTYDKKECLVVVQDLDEIRHAQVVQENILFFHFRLVFFFFFICQEIGFII